MTERSRQRVRVGLMAMTVAGGAWAGTAPAQSPIRHFVIERQSLGTALQLFAVQSGRSVVAASKLTAGKQARSVIGDLSPERALDALLKGSGLHSEMVEGTIVLRPDAIDTAPSAKTSEIIVTGSRIRGAPAASPLIQLGRQQIIDAGQSTLVEALASLPQNFTGGQNPGVMLGAASANPANGNSSGGSAINLRGLGADATLTLINGHRVAYDGSAQGVDIASIPLAALDRIEIVADGASALYGSDAVGGVANIVLRKDYDGLALTARGGAATQGDNGQQLYSAVAGRRWTTGGLILTYSHQRDGEIRGSQREFTDYLLRPTSLLPELRSDGVIASAHQDLADGLTASIDGTFNHRSAHQDLAIPGSATRQSYHVLAFSVTPSLSSHIGAWALGVSGSYGQDRDRSLAVQTLTGTGVRLSTSAGCLCNTLLSGETTGEGPLVTLPAGAARLALGAGYRENDLDNRNSLTGTIKQAERKSGYGYGELFVPLVAADMQVPLVRTLSVTVALRYEHYADLGGVRTPKVGVLFTPVDGIDIKASWGKSFKAPLLSQQYLQAAAYLYSAAYMGGSRFPATATALLAYGSAGGLKPERATSWTTTVDLHPAIAPRVHALASFFHVDYRDRIIQPASITAALSSPLYADFVTYNPTIAEQQAVIAQAPTGLTNFAGRPYDPATVVAIVDDYFTNIAAQTIKGVDVEADYQADLAGGDLNLTAQASYLDSRQRNGPQAPSIALAGTLYNPPHIKGRIGAIWKTDRITASTFLNYVGPVADTRQTPAAGGESMASIDLALRWTSSLFGNAKRALDLALAVQNLTDERPPSLSHPTNYYVPYDSTNYSAVGRTVALEVTTRW